LQQAIATPSARGSNRRSPVRGRGRSPPERIGVEKGLKKKRSGIRVKKSSRSVVDRAKASRVRQGDGKMPDIAPQTEKSGPEQAKMMKKEEHE